MATKLRQHYVEFSGGIEERYSNVNQDDGLLLSAVNVEVKTSKGLRRIDGYTRYDPAEVPGTGPILGVWEYGGKVYAFREQTATSLVTMFSSVGSGWTADKVGLATDGKYEFVNEDFAGVQKMYGVSGVHQAFQWDGTVWTDIPTLMAVDTPNHIIAFKKHLFLSFGSSVQNSGLGLPLSWTLVTGANEVAIGDPVTGFMRMSGGVLGIFSRNSTNILSGSSTGDFVNANLSEHGLKIGAIESSLQQLGSRLYYLDDRGVVDFYTSQNFGDFDDATISYSVNGFLSIQSEKVASSCVVRNKTQYRLFFTDGTGMIFSFEGNKVKGITRTLFTDSAGAALPVRCVANAEDATGKEQILFGSDDGYVRLMDSGQNFDGFPIEAYAKTLYTHAGMPEQEKQWKVATLDIRSEGLTTIHAQVDFQQQKPNTDLVGVTSTGSNAILGSALLGSAILGSNPVQSGRVWMPGQSEYANMTIYSNADEPAWEIAGIMYKYLPGRRLI